MKTTKEQPAAKIANDISVLVRQAYKDSLRISNYVTLELFWKIGNTINQHLKSRSDMKREEVTSQLAALLYSQLGSLFDLQGLSSMQVFALSCPQELMAKLASYLSWEHIQALKSVSDADEWIYYTRLAVAGDLTPTVLYEQIKAQLYENSSPISLKFPDLPLYDLELTKYKNGNIPFKDYLLHPLVPGFRKLLEPQSGKQLKHLINHLPDLALSALIKQIYVYISDYRRYLNNWLNGRFNIMHAEIGRLINENEAYSKSGSSERKNITCEITDFIVPKSGELTTPREIELCASLSSMFSENRDLLKVAELVRWEHFMILAPITDNEERLFYARMVALRNWNTTYLKKQIRENFYQNNVTKKREGPSNEATYTNGEVDLKTNNIEHKNQYLTGIRVAKNEEVKNSKATANIYNNLAFIEFMQTQTLWS